MPPKKQKKSTLKSNPFLESMPPPLESSSKKEKEIYNLAVIANGIVVHKWNDKNDEEDMEKNKMAKDVLEELKEWAENKGPKPKNTMVFLDEELYMACNVLQIRFEIGHAWEERQGIKADLAWELKNIH